eukprot:COSAG01_NODE_654_length_14482_cov_20.826347_5_plen_70_part_00
MARSRKFRSRCPRLVLYSATFSADCLALVRPSWDFPSFYPVFAPGFRGLPCFLAPPTWGPRGVTTHDRR